MYLTTGVLLFITASGLFAIIAANVATSGSLTLIDVRVAHWFHAHTHPALTTWMLLVTYVHSTLGVSMLSLLAAMWLAHKKEKYWVAVLAVAIPGGLLMNVAIKHVFQRPRPSFVDPLLTLTTYSFPSGHTVGATLFYGVLVAYWNCHTHHSWGRRALIVLVAVFMVTVVGISRMYLGVHYLSDVLGAIAEGLAWIALCLTSISYWRRRKEARHPGAPW